MLIIIYAGQAAHRGSEATSSQMGEAPTWRGMMWDSKNFVANYLQGALYLSGLKVPQLLATAQDATKPSEVFIFNYFFLSKGIDDRKPALVIKDNLSRFCWIAQTVNASPGHAAEILARW